jgi:cytochrome c553
MEPSQVDSAKTSATTGSRRFAILGILALTLCGPAAADPPGLSAEIERCAGCHGNDGRAAALPTAGRIAGQNLEYLRYILRQYRLGRLQGLNGGLMTNAVRHLDDAQLQALARYYAGLP